MSAVKQGVIIECDECHIRSYHTSCTTVAGARGVAERSGWSVAYLTGGLHPTKRSNDPKAPDVCPACRPKPTKPEGGLL